MTGLTQTTAHSTSAMENDSFTETISNSGNVYRTTSCDHTQRRPHTEKLKRTTKFGRLLQRSMSLVQPKRMIEKEPSSVTPSSSTSNSPQDILTPTPTTTTNSSIQSADEESDSDQEGITNAFIFSTTPENSSSFLTNSQISCHRTTEVKTTVKAVRVTRVHSQKSPHISYAASKLSLGDFKDLQWSSSGRQQVKQTDILIPVQKPDLRKTDSCPLFENGNKAKQGKFPNQIYISAFLNDKWP